MKHSPRLAKSSKEPLILSEAAQDFLAKYPGLDYDTQRVPLITTGAIIPDNHFRRSYDAVPVQAIPATVGLRNSVTGQILGTAGGSAYVKYQPCQNAFLVECLAQAGFLNKSKTLGVDILKGGAIAVIRMAVNDPKNTFTMKDKGGLERNCHFRFTVINGHDGMRSLSIRPLIHLPAANGKGAKDLPLFNGNSVIKEANIRHTSSIHETSNNLVKMWGETLERGSEAVAALHNMQNYRITDKDLKAILLATMKKSMDPSVNNCAAAADKLRGAIWENAAPENLLQLAEDLVFYVDNVRTTKQSRKASTTETRMESAQIGRGAKIKNEILKAAINMLNGKPI